MADRLLEPRPSLALESKATPDSLGMVQRLIVVDEDLDRVRNTRTDGARYRDVLCQGRIAEPQLDRPEPAFEQQLRFIGGRFRRHQAQSTGIVSRDRPRSGAQQCREREAGGLRPPGPQRAL